GSGLFWGWMPIKSGISGIVYQDVNTALPSSKDTDRNGDSNPDSWPEAWEGLWPGKRFAGQALGDNEIIYGMDDSDNKEFKYYPFPEDSAIGGLGLEVETRVIQIQDFYEDIVFVIFNIRNNSGKDLNTMIMGVYGDPHIGGSFNYADDLMSYNKSKNLMYVWDYDGISDIAGLAPGYFGVTYLQTAGNDSDGIDNDRDGMIDESPYNGIDDDGDWDILRDDVGKDGIASTGDEGEGNGVPDTGEPNFEMNDIDETDMIGLTSSRQGDFGSLYINQDEKMWNYLQPGFFDTLVAKGDRSFLSGSGYFSLKANSTCQIAIAYVLGSDLNDLYANVDVANEIYRSYLGSLTSKVKYSITSIDSGDVYADQIPVLWESDKIDANSELEFALSKDNGKEWLAADRNVLNSGSFNIDVRSFPSSAFYKIRSRVLGNSEFGQSQSEGFFTIDNSGQENVAPEILPLFDDQIQLSGDAFLKWLSADVDGDNFTTRLILESGLVSDTLYPESDFVIIPTKNYPNDQYILHFFVNDGKNEREYSTSFTILNSFSQVDSSLLYHKNGYSESSVNVNIINENELKSTLFKLTFNQVGNETVYSIFDSLKNIKIIENEKLPIEPYTGSLFNGLRLSFIDIPFDIDEENTGWTETSITDLEYSFIKRDSAKFYPSDYEIRFYDDSVGVALTGQSINFEVRNITRNLKNYVAVTEPTTQRDGKWDPGDNIFILENVSDPSIINAKKTTWQVLIEPSFDNPGAIPGDGDILFIKTFKPLTADDIYLIDTRTLAIENENANYPDEFRLAQNYPNPFNSLTKIEFYLPKPETISIEIFNVLGEKVFTRSLGKLKPGLNEFIWNGKNNFNDSVSSGIYFYQLKGITRSSIKKMVLLK
ncbi:MAG: T9SS type A sorting domain-containing protein, partial [Calditrichaeota bacterium]|nr:T9SS type A sorting domain-containing protein [Calditrichota bacterium]